MFARRRRRGTPAPVLWLLLGELVMVMGASALFPVVPLYVRHHGGGPVAVALFVAGPLLANALVLLPAGRLVDRAGRKPIMVGSLGGFAVLSTFLALDHGPLWLLAALRAGQGVTNGIYMPALRATLADLTPPERRAERYGQLQSFVMVGILVGPAVGGALAVVRDSLIFACSGLGAVVALTVIALRVPETAGMAVASARAAGSVQGDRGSLPLTDSEPRLARPGWWRTAGVLVPMVGLGAMGTVMSMYDVVWPLYLSGRGQGTVVIGLSVTLFAVPLMLLSPRGGRLADKGNRRLLLGASFAVAAATAVSYPFIHPLWLILTVGTVEAVSWVATEPTLYAVITDTAPVDARGRAMAAGGFSEYVGSAVGALGLGALFALGEGIPFFAGASVLALAGLLCATRVPRRAARLPVAEDAKPGLLAVAVLEDGDDRGRPDVDRPVHGGQLHEALGAGHHLDGGDGVGDAELDVDVVPVGESHDGHGRHPTSSARSVEGLGQVVLQVAEGLDAGADPK